MVFLEGIIGIPISSPPKGSGHFIKELGLSFIAKHLFPQTLFSSSRFLPKSLLITSLLADSKEFEVILKQDDFHKTNKYSLTKQICVWPGVFPPFYYLLHFLTPFLTLHPPPHMQQRQSHKRKHYPSPQPKATVQPEKPMDHGLYCFPFPFS